METTARKNSLDPIFEPTSLWAAYRRRQNTSAADRQSKPKFGEARPNRAAVRPSCCSVFLPSLSCHQIRNPNSARHCTPIKYRIPQSFRARLSKLSTFFLSRF
jgi:hypothetical protein